MVLFTRQPRRNRRGVKSGIVCMSLASIFGHINSLALPVRRLGLTSASMIAADAVGGINNSSEDDLDLHAKTDDKYAYVHPSIRRVLVMERGDIPLDFLESEGADDKNNDNVIMVDRDTYTIRWKVLENFLERENSKANTQELHHTISMEQLVLLASQCDEALFKDYNKRVPPVIPAPIRGLLRILPEESYTHPNCRVGEDGGARCLIATTLALNMVENSIRHLIGKKNGRAPLLKDMIEIMAIREGETILPKSLTPVVRTLLLPTNGLNLRNLVWHGFLPTIPRRWLALSVVLTLSLDELAGSSSFEASSFGGDLEPIAAMRKYDALVTVLDHGKEILESEEKLASLKTKMIQSNIIPRSHTELLDVALQFVHQPIIFASVVGPLIEHLLRLMWCHENQENKQIAEPGSYYVTLDGHGQKEKHDITIMPFICQQGVAKERRNKLVYHLGGTTMAFLMDIFTSPSGGPNIRATVAHGSFNQYLFEELVAIGERGRDGMGRNADKLMDVTNALLSVLNILSEDRENNITGVCRANTDLSFYRPSFSYTALLLAEVRNMVKSMKSFYDFIESGHHLQYARNAPQSQMQIETAQKIASMSQGFNVIDGLQARICQNFGTAKSHFTDENFFQESSNNSIASQCGAAKLLLSEIAVAASASLRDLDDGISAFQSEEIELSSRRRKQVSRICATAQLTLDFYSFTAYCALLYIERQQDTSNSRKNTEFERKLDLSPTNDELFVAVKRSRMVVSTFSTTKAFDRALAALVQYTAGKAIKSVSESIQNSSIQ